MSYVRVAINRPLRTTFDYKPAANTTLDDYAPGQRVEVSFGPNKTVALVLEIVSEAAVAANKIRPILRILDDRPLLDELNIRLIHWLASYYSAPIGEVATLFFPPLLRKAQAAEPQTQDHWQITEQGQQADTSSLKGERQQQLLRTLQQHRSVAASELRLAGLSSSQFRALAKRGWIEQKAVALLPKPWQYRKPQTLTANPEQQQALTKFDQHQGFAVFLLYGVTGSGKTEVFMQMMDRILAKGQQVLMMVPEIGLTPQSIDRLAKRFGCPIAMLHSGLTEQERLNAWISAHRGLTPIVLGTRSSVFVPVKNLGLIIIDEEHDHSFKQQDGIRYHGRDVAIKRAQQLNIPIVLASATPSLETWHHSEQNKYHTLVLSQRAGEAKLPFISTIDIRNAEMEGGLSTKLENAMEEHLQQGQQVLLFLNRRGYAPTLFCNGCGWIAQCPHCDARLTLHRHPDHLACHHCSSKMVLPDRCPSCHQKALVPIGTGTVKTEEYLTQRFNYPVIRVDRDSVKNTGQLNAKLAQVNQGDPCILIGTQMLAKGHHLSKVTLVAVLDADSGFFTTDFRGEERMMQLLMQVAGRAGRESLRGEVLLQTRYPAHPLFELLRNQDYRHIAQTLLAKRQSAHLPPYGYVHLIRSEHKREYLGASVLAQLRQALTQLGLEIEVLGPVPALLSKRAGYYRYWLWLQSPQRKPLHQATQWASKWLQEHHQGTSWGLDVDAQDVV